MLISKFDLYKSEWLDLVFENRNKAYGAYELRQHNGRTTAKAMAITFLTIGIAVGVNAVFFRPKPPMRGLVVEVFPPVVPPVIAKVKPVEPPAPQKSTQPAHTTPPVATTAFPPPVIVVDTKAIVAPPTMDDLKDATISTETTKGAPSTGNELPVADKGTPGPPAVDNTIHNVGTLDFMPEPVGGAEAWAKFLNKTLRFPAIAQEDGVSGKVIMSFVIEKDGSLSNIVVERGAGHGFDEEAARVLKLAKAWKPGLQNGQPVRVKYVIPINFQLGSDN